MGSILKLPNGSVVQKNATASESRSCIPGRDQPMDVVSNCMDRDDSTTHCKLCKAAPHLIGKVKVRCGTLVARHGAHHVQQQASVGWHCPRLWIALEQHKDGAQILACRQHAWLWHAGWGGDLGSACTAGEL